MTVEKQLYEEILRDLNLGNPIAELDTSLDDARIETPTFDGVVRDEYDIVTGRKGAGKTAIYRLISHELSSYFLNTQRVVILSGVNSTGESIFNHFKSDFEKFDEAEFENFWKLYIITLIYNQFLNNPQYETYLSDCKEEIKNFKRACDSAGIPDIKSQMDRKDMIGWVLNTFKKLRIKGAIATDTSNPNLLLFTGSVDFDNKTKVDQKEIVSLYVETIGKSLAVILKKSRLKIWVVLDRLDEVFERYSMIEFNGLRGLLRSYKSFELPQQSELFRLKIFLRDDIKEFLTNSEVFKKYYPLKKIPPLAAATHIFAKESPVLSWTEDEIEQLILMRLLISNELRRHLGIDPKIRRSELYDLMRDKRQRITLWNQIFPEKITNSSSLVWMYSRLRDSNGVVTPRSVIDMLNAAKNYQLKKLVTNFQDSSHIFTVEAIKEGIVDASKKKLELDIYNEFPTEQANIKLIGNYGKHKLSKTDLIELFGNNWSIVAESLRRIGVLRFVKNSNDYMVEFVFRSALGITYKY